jgi:hypothetical protein
MDVLKMVEEALVAALRLDPTCEHEDTHRGGAIWTICDQCGKRWADDEGGLKPDPPNQTVEQILAALTALRGLEWKPVTEMGDERYMKGAWGGCWQQNILGHWTWRIGCQVPDKTYAEMCGYTHFCRPILPTPPKREAE